MTEEEKRPIVILRMKGGIEIVGEVAQETDKIIYLRSPLQTVYKMIPGFNVPYVTFKHYILFAADGIHVPFKKEDISVQVPARETFARFYRMQIKTDDLIQNIDKQFDRLTSETRRDTLTDKEKEELNHLNYLFQLEAFDETQQRPN